MKYTLAFVILFIFCVYLKADDNVAYYKVDITKFESSELIDFRNYLIGQTQFHSQPCCRYSAMLNTNKGLTFSDYKYDIKVDDYTLESIISFDDKLAESPTVKLYEQLGYITKIGIMRVDEHGFVYDNNWGNITDEIRTFKNTYKSAEQIAIESSIR